MSIDLFDILAVVGFIVLVTGTALLSVPGALIVAGSLLLVFALYGSQRMSGN